ncbi:MAG: hypothetical protein IJF96_02855 [Firmicutes bacterium]|nr:hypothetical protein [Bacillota bacterium]
MIDKNVKSRAEEVYEQFCHRHSKDDEFNDWEGYRTQLTDFVIRNIKPGSSLLILGAGKCSDLDLGMLSEHCGSITLSDYRPETAEEAFRQYGLQPSGTLRFSGSDYVGITDGDYIHYTETLLAVMEKLRDCPGDSLESSAGSELQELRNDLEQIYRNNEAYEIDLGGVYDNAVIAGVHSQLNNSFRGIFQYARKYTEDRGGKIRYLNELNAAIFETTGKHSLYLVRRLNEAVFSSVREGVIYGYEKRIIFTPEGAESPVIGTVDGARQAGEEVEGFNAADRMGCLWPLSRRRGVKFEMDICCFKAAELKTANE